MEQERVEKEEFEKYLKENDPYAQTPENLANQELQAAISRAKDPNIPPITITEILAEFQEADERFDAWM